LICGMATTERTSEMLKGFKEFLARGNIIDLSVAVVIGTAFTGLVTKFTESVIQPLIDRAGAGGKSSVGILKIDLGDDHFIDFNVAISAAINFLLIAAVVYFLVVLPYNTLRKRGEVKQAEDTELSLLTQIRDLLAESEGSSAGSHSANAPESATIEDK
jgi:large conductance mechanosensitive channel